MVRCSIGLLLCLTCVFSHDLVSKYVSKQVRIAAVLSLCIYEPPTVATLFHASDLGPNVRDCVQRHPSSEGIVALRVSNSPVRPFVAAELDTKEIIIAFRGSATGEDIGQDLQAWMQASNGEGRVHAGFLQASRNLPVGLIVQYLARGPVTLTGHSLGGAIAQVVASELLSDPTLPKSFGDKLSCITFGSPMVVDTTLVKAMKHQDRIRQFTHFVNQRDIVPRALLILQSLLSQEGIALASKLATSLLALFSSEESLADKSALDQLRVLFSRVGDIFWGNYDVLGNLVVLRSTDDPLYCTVHTSLTSFCGPTFCEGQELVHYTRVDDLLYHSMKNYMQALNTNIGGFANNVELLKQDTITFETYGTRDATASALCDFFPHPKPCFQVTILGQASNHIAFLKLWHAGGHLSFFRRESKPNQTTFDFCVPEEVGRQINDLSMEVYDYWGKKHSVLPPHRLRGSLSRLIMANDLAIVEQAFLFGLRDIPSHLQAARTRRDKVRQALIELQALWKQEGKSFFGLSSSPVSDLRDLKQINHDKSRVLSIAEAFQAVYCKDTRLCVKDSIWLIRRFKDAFQDFDNSPSVHSVNPATTNLAIPPKVKAMQDMFAAMQTLHILMSTSVTQLDAHFLTQTLSSPAFLIGSSLVTLLSGGGLPLAFVSFVLHTGAKWFAAAPDMYAPFVEQIAKQLQVWQAEHRLATLETSIIDKLKAKKVLAQQSSLLFPKFLVSDSQFEAIFFDYNSGLYRCHPIAHCISLLKSIVYVNFLRSMLSQETTVGILGTGNAGKSTLVQRLLGDIAQTNPSAIDRTIDVAAYYVNDCENLVVLDFPHFGGRLDSLSVSVAMYQALSFVDLAVVVFEALHTDDAQKQCAQEVLALEVPVSFWMNKAGAILTDEDCSPKLTRTEADQWRAHTASQFRVSPASLFLASWFFGGRACLDATDAAFLGVKNASDVSAWVLQQLRLRNFNAAGPVSCNEDRLLNSNPIPPDSRKRQPRTELR